MAPPVVLCLSPHGRETAAAVAAALKAPLHTRADRVEPGDVVFANALTHARDLFAAGHGIVGVCAAGILIRAVAPLLSDKRIEPPVIAIPDTGSTIIPLLGGHRGANRLARTIAQSLGVEAAVTTAGDLALGAALDEPPAGYRLAKDAGSEALARALRGGVNSIVDGDAPAPWDLPENPNAAVTLLTTERPTVPAADRLVYHPQRHVLGLGCARGADPDAMAQMIDSVLQQANVAPEALAAVATVALKADEPAILAAAGHLGVPLRLFTPEELDALTARVANPSEVVFAEVGTHSVAEAAALAAAGSDAVLVVPKVKSPTTTCAIARAPTPIADPAGRPRGVLSLVGIGPGRSDWRTPEASRFVAEADELVGYGLYIDLLGPIAAGKPRHDFPLGGEEDRCRFALEEAGRGRNVALICSGDSGIYAMGALVYELLDRARDTGGVSDAARRVAVRTAPGVSALQAAAARSGAPLGHDFCAISLSDLLTPRDDIVRRIRAAAEGDFVVAFYNPVSKRRRTLLAEARDMLLLHRPADTPVLLAASLGRPEERLRLRTLADLDVDEVDMLTTVIVGSAQSRVAELGEGPKIYTPRGYARKIDGDLAS
ncbi:MAG: precorrin-3B C(17)-methyltransferase [Pseudomonadota bacterium]